MAAPFKNRAERRSPRICSGTLFQTHEWKPVAFGRALTAQEVGFIPLIDAVDPCGLDDPRLCERQCRVQRRHRHRGFQI
jgi:hypothetical protein